MTAALRLTAGRCPVCGAHPGVRPAPLLLAALQAGRLPTPPRPGRGPRAGRQRSRSEIVYQCPSCEERYLGEQRCEDCNTFCRRLGVGGACPHCDGPVAVADLVAGG